MTPKIVGVCLMGVVLSLLLVGVVSATPVRHTVQVIPVVIALTAVARRAGWAVDAARPLFLFWLFIVLAIWLYLLGIANVATGRYTPAEVVLTIIIGVSCFWGLVASLHLPSAATKTSRLVTSAVFAVLQVGVLWVSLQPAIAQR